MLDGESVQAAHIVTAFSDLERARSARDSVVLRRRYSSAYRIGVWAEETDTTAPTVSNAAIAANGTTLTVQLSESNLQGSLWDQRLEVLGGRREREDSVGRELK